MFHNSAPTRELIAVIRSLEFSVTLPWTPIAERTFDFRLDHNHSCAGKDGKCVGKARQGGVCASPAVTAVASLVPAVYLYLRSCLFSIPTPPDIGSGPNLRTAIGSTYDLREITTCEMYGFHHSGGTVVPPLRPACLITVLEVKRENR